MNVLYSLHRFFKYDKAMALLNEGSIRDFFEASGGIEALAVLETNPNSDINGQVSEMM